MSEVRTGEPTQAEIDELVERWGNAHRWVIEILFGAERGEEHEHDDDRGNMRSSGLGGGQA